MTSTKIEWAEVVWNPVTGCTKVGAGCKHCYAARMWPRLASMSEKYADRDFGDVGLHYSVLDEPMRWKKPRVVFVNSMGDLFHKDVPDEFIQSVWVRMSMSDRHTYIVLTKRPERMRDWARAWNGCYAPSPNVVLGVSCSTQSEADRDIPLLLDTPAATRIVSLEPLLGPVDLTEVGGVNYTRASDGVCRPLLRYDALRGHEQCGPAVYEQGNRLSGVIVGGETGPGARPMHPDWVRSLRDQCAASDTPFFFKQWGEWAPDCLCDTKDPHTTTLRPEPGKPGVMFRCGKHRAGRLLDGVTHDALPCGVELKQVEGDKP